ncbi:hypothetical protein EDB80DRAFT_777269 [Ilyonectria destructans]|nr:hypothetical protein EDB80DRAFT_777269 [Ilyonectria destructans]
MPPIYEKYFKAKSTWYRTFKANCVAALKDAKKNNGVINIDLLPPPTEYLASLMGMKDFSEEYLPKEWMALADLNPPLIRLYRRGAAELRNQDNDQKFQVPLRNEDKYMKKKFLTLINKEYEGGSVPDNIKPEHSHRTELDLIPATPKKTPTRKPAKTSTPKKPRTLSVPKKRKGSFQEVKAKKKARTAGPDEDDDTDATFYTAKDTDSENDTGHYDDHPSDPTAKRNHEDQTFPGIQTRDSGSEGCVYPDIQTQDSGSKGCVYPSIQTQDSGSKGCVYPSIQTQDSRSKIPFSPFIPESHSSKTPQERIAGFCGCILNWVTSERVQPLDPSLFTDLPAVIPDSQLEDLRIDSLLTTRLTCLIAETLDCELKSLKALFLEGEEDVIQGCFRIIIPRFICLLGLNPTSKPPKFGIMKVKDFIIWLRKYDNGLVHDCLRSQYSFATARAILERFGEFSSRSFAVSIAKNNLDLDGIYNDEFFVRVLDTLRSIQTRDLEIGSFKILRLFLLDF